MVRSPPPLLPRDPSVANGVASVADDATELGRDVVACCGRLLAVVRKAGERLN